MEVAGPSHHIQEQMVRRQRQPVSATIAKKQEPQPAAQQLQVRDELGKAFANNSSLNNLLYPSALVNLPQEVLMNLVQSGHLQVEEEGNFRFQSGACDFQLNKLQPLSRSRRAI